MRVKGGRVTEREIENRRAGEREQERYAECYCSLCLPGRVAGLVERGVEE